MSQATESLTSSSAAPDLKTVKAYASYEAGGVLRPFSLERRDLRPTDVLIEILWCGVCHADLHLVRNDVSSAIPVSYPFVPGHEIIGRVTSAGNAVNKFRIGDIAAVTAICDSCRSCENCVRGLEQYCVRTTTFTHNAPDPFLPGRPTYGGYSQRIVVDERYALMVPANLGHASAAPLLCAGITMYSPLRHARVQRGDKVGIVGLGGLGHLGIRLSRALGAEVTVFTTSESKAENARQLGAHDVVLTNNSNHMARQAGGFQLILDTVSADHDVTPYLLSLKLDGSLALLGWPSSPVQVPALALDLPRRHIFGSFIGSPSETQELLNFAGEHGVVADVEIIGIEEINQAYTRLMNGDVRYRFVIDMSSLG